MVATTGLLLVPRTCSDSNKSPSVHVSTTTARDQFVLLTVTRPRGSLPQSERESTRSSPPHKSTPEPTGQRGAHGAESCADGTAEAKATYCSLFGANRSSIRIGSTRVL